MSEQLAEAVKAELAPETKVLIKLDLGCGKNKAAGFLGVDQRQFDGVDATTNLMSRGKWKFAQGKIGELTLETVHPYQDDHSPTVSSYYVLPDNSVEEAHCSHFLEHIPGALRPQFFNELYRVLIPGGKCQIITPYWASNRAYGDFTHQWPPVSEMMYFYLDRQWRKTNAPDNDIEWNPEGYTCDFAVTGGYTLHPEIMAKNQTQQTFATTFYKEAAQDFFATAVARK